MPDIAAWLGTPEAAILLVSAMTAIAFFEAGWLPWSPFFFLFPILSVAVPLMARSHAFGELRSLFAQPWKSFLPVVMALILWETGLCLFVFEGAILRRLGKNRNPEYSPGAAMDLLIEQAGRNHKLPPWAVNGTLLIYALVWAPLGEELFYWGYCYATLRPSTGAGAATLAVSVFFALRHAWHFLYLRPRVPKRATLALCVSAFGSAILNSMLYEKTRSLYLLIFLHFFANLMALLFHPGKNRLP